MYEDIIRKIQVCVPFKLLKDKYLPMVVEHRINPELGIDGDTIDTHSSKALSEVASILRREGLSITLHGPFFDLVPGGFDKKVLKATRERLKQMFDIVPVFEPKSVVFHSGYDRKRYGDAEDVWLDTSLETWRPLIESLKGSSAIMVLENVYERTPKMLQRLLDALDADKVGLCFDVGHMNSFSETSMAGWLDEIGPRIKQLHLHDNDGIWDSHMAIGAGNIDFEQLFRYLEQNHSRPIITLEAHKERWIWQSLEVLSRSDRFCRIVESR